MDRKELLFRLLGKDDASPAANKVAGAFEHLADKADDATRSTDKLGNSTTVAKGKTSALGSEVRETARGVDKLTDEIQKAERELDSLARAFMRTDVAAERMDISKAMRKQQADITKMSKVKNRMSVDIMPDIDPSMFAKLSAGLRGAFASVSASSGPLIAAGIATAAPMIGATLAGAVVGGAGIGGIVGGVLLASKDARVKAAAKALGTDIGKDLTDLAAPMVPAVLKSLDQVRVGFHALRPDLADIFKDSSGMLEPLVRGTVEGVRSIVSGVRDAVSKAGPVIDQLGAGIEDIGGAIGHMFSELSEHSEEGASALEQITDGTVALINGTTKVVGALSTVYGWYLKINDAILTFSNMEIGAKTLGPLALWVRALGNVDEENKKIMHSAPSAAEAQKTNTDAIKAQADAVKDLKAKYDSLTEANLSAFDAQIAAKAQIRETTEAIKKNGEATSNNTAKGRANNEAISNLAHKFNTLQDATERSGASTARTNGIYASNRSKLIAQAEAAGYSASKARQLADDLLKIPTSRVTTVKANTGSATANVAEFKHSLSGIPRNITTYVNVMGNKAYGEYYSGGKMKARERGGPVRAGEAYIVGEKRPELFVPDSNGTILPDVGTARTGGGRAQAGVNAAGVIVNVYAHPSNNPAEIGREVAATLGAYYRNGGVRP